MGFKLQQQGIIKNNVSPKQQ